ncbi:MAG: asparagine synthase (glutamine-hydrolyzing) [Bacteroidetes bacterium]|nr:asparagine synthase (glutamine-hydrolyzing) [Bacteroidota bacterium]MBS1649253.1 asparagine synthase (glutamine-hydrolyzing) [Bacteroidota bacterium]
MCRIAGVISKKINPDEAFITQMRDSMQHGGPDGCGVYINKELGLAFGHRRLALIDLSPLGIQPMMDKEERIVIIFNGEIYNYQEIKDKLLAKGYNFKSSSDTEVIIYAYIEWGTDCFQHLNGMFALVLLDKLTNKLILARDHAGIKPLYYYLKNNELYFASEVRAFKTINPSWQENSEWKKYFLLFGHLPEPITTLQDIQPLEKGTFLEIDLNTWNTRQESFHKLYYNYTIYKEEEALPLIKETLQKSVQRHLISDAPIGLFLSGGIDSSLLTLLAQPFVNNNLHTLSIIFDNEKFSEKQYQNIIIQKTKAQHKSFLVTENEFRQSIPDIIKAMDQPSNDGINSYFICKYARQYGLTAVLSGLGADELFGGYQSFNRTKAVGMINWLPEFIFEIANIFPDDRRKKINFLQLKDALGEYLFNRGFFVPAQIAQLLDCTEKELYNLLDNVRLPLFTEKLLPLEKISYIETNLYMQNQLLKDTDYMSMWHSLEVRVPFLDKELINLLYSIVPEIRYNPNQIKHLLIKAFKNELPETIWNRPKQGFVFPFEMWMKHVQLQQQNKNAKQLLKGLTNGNIHWSRYWCYILSQPNNQLKLTASYA